MAKTAVAKAANRITNPIRPFPMKVLRPLKTIVEEYESVAIG